MYRALALAATRENIDTRDEAKLEDLASRTRIDFIPGERARVLLNGEDVTSMIRTPEMSMAASNVSAVPAVRRVLVRLQQDLGRRSGGVLEGRDIGTKVFPETPLQILPHRPPRGPRPPPPRRAAGERGGRVLRNRSSPAPSPATTRTPPAPTPPSATTTPTPSSTPRI